MDQNSAKDGGYIYILSNPLLKDLFKVGHATNIPQRLKQLSSPTGVFESFVCEHYLYAPDPFKLEKLVHKKLHGSRYSSRREAFNAPIQHIKDVINESYYELFGHFPSPSLMEDKAEDTASVPETHKSKLKTSVRVSVAALKGEGASKPLEQEYFFNQMSIEWKMKNLARHESKGVRSGESDFGIIINSYSGTIFHDFTNQIGSIEMDEIRLPPILYYIGYGQNLLTMMQGISKDHENLYHAAFSQEDCTIEYRDIPSMKEGATVTLDGVDTILFVKNIHVQEKHRGKKLGLWAIEIATRNFESDHSLVYISLQHCQPLAKYFQAAGFKPYSCKTGPMKTHPFMTAWSHCVELPAALKPEKN